MSKAWIALVSQRHLFSTTMMTHSLPTDLARHSVAEEGRQGAALAEISLRGEEEEIRAAQPPENVLPCQAKGCLQTGTLTKGLGLLVAPYGSWAPPGDSPPNQ